MIGTKRVVMATRKGGQFKSACGATVRCPICDPTTPMVREQEEYKPTIEPGAAFLGFYFREGRLVRPNGRVVRY
jgi:hypothetical protein